MQKRQIARSRPATQRRSVSVSKRSPPSPPESVPRLSYSVPEAAMAMGVSDSTVKRLIQDGTLASIKVKGRRMISIAAINRFLST